MLDYRNFTANDFAMDDFFREWVLQPNTLANAFWTQWLKDHPEQAPTIALAKKTVWTLRNAQNEISDNEIVVAVAEIVAAANQKEAQKQPPRRIKLFTKQTIAWAASMALLIGLAWIVYLRVRHQPSELYLQTVAQVVPAQKVFEQVNTGSQAMLITLEDGSSVLLQPHSRLSYPTTFDDTARKVVLSGEAFFEVAKNPKKPFYVYANELITKVLGTSFTIKAFDQDAQVEVIVKTGKVWVYTHKSQSQKEVLQATLLPHQQATLLRTQLALQKSLPSTEVLQALPTIQTQLFEFKHTPLATVFHTLEETYHVEIEYNEEQMKACELTASLGDEPLYEKIRLICEVIEASYEIHDNTIVIQGKPCN